MQISNYQVPINWRRVHSSFLHPHEHIETLGECCVVLPNDLSLFLSVDGIVDVREIRDWLHDKAHTNGQYSIFGCYRTTRSKYRYTSEFRGIIVVFCLPIHAYHFRLCWNANLWEAAA